MQPTVFIVAFKDQSGSAKPVRISIQDCDGNDIPSVHVAMAVPVVDWKRPFAMFSQIFLEPAFANIRNVLGLT